MRIREIQIDGYGIYHDMHLDLCPYPSAITIFYGPNEAGKSTLHSFIRSILFGFQLRGLPSYEAIQGGTLGGRITLEDGHGKTYHLERKAPPKKGKATLYREDGTEKEEAYLKQLLGHISAPLFTNIFAFRHQELQKIDSLQGEEVAAYLYSAALGNGASHLLEVEKKTNKLRERMFKPRASNPLLNQLLKELEEYQLDIEKLQGKLAIYTSLKQQLNQHKEQLLQLRQQRENLEEQRRYYEKMQKLIDLKDQLRDVEEEREKLEAFPKPLLPMKAEIQSLLFEERRMKEKEEECYRLKEQIKNGQKKVTEYLSLLGTAWDMKKVERTEISIPFQDKLVQLARKKEKAVDAHRQIEEKYEQKKKEVEHDSPLHTNKRKIKTSLLSLILIFALPALLVWRFEQNVAAIILFFSLIWFTRLQFQKEKETMRKERQLTQSLDQLEQEKEEKEQELQHISALLERELLSIPFSATLSSAGLTHMLQTLRETQKEVIQLDHALLQERSNVKVIEDWKVQIQEIASLGKRNRVDQNPYLLMEELKEQLSQEEELQKQIDVIHSKQKQLEHQMESVFSDEQEMQEKLENILEETDKEELTRQLATVNLNYDNMLQEIEELAMEIGKLETQMKDLEGEQRFSLQQQEMEEKKAHFQEEAKQWVVYTLAEHLCQQIRKVYEEERQPTVLQNASLFFEKMTSGRYKQIIIPFGQKHLVVIREDNQRLSVHQLSQGTVEQLYLAMRFAVIKDYEKIACLPVIMDDIFVNFDSMRVKEALYGLQELSQAHQIILFTCHEHMLQQVQEVMGAVNVIELKQEAKAT